MVLIDTSAWIDFFKNKSPLSLGVDHLLEMGEAAWCGPIQMEIQRGLRSPKETQNVLELLTGCHFLLQPENLWKEAGLLGNFLAKKGLNVKSFDLIIATYAWAHETSLLTTDSDFKKMQQVGVALDLYEP